MALVFMVPPLSPAGIEIRSGWPPIITITIKKKGIET
jgi:hypothetical protein